MPESPLAHFLERLFSDGKTMVNPGPDPVKPDAAAEAWLRRAWQADVWHFPGEAPDYDPGVALQGAVWLYHAAMCYADRSMTAEASGQLLVPPLVGRRDAVAHYSLDLTLRHLPALHGFATGLSDGDPVLGSLCRMAWLWPLSGVGVPWPKDWGLPELQSVQDHPGLWRLYLDRVIAGGEASNLRDEATRIATRDRLGLHRGLALRLVPHWRAEAPAPLSLPSQTAVS